MCLEAGRLQAGWHIIPAAQLAQEIGQHSIHHAETAAFLDNPRSVVVQCDRLTYPFPIFERSLQTRGTLTRDIHVGTILQWSGGSSGAEVHHNEERWAMYSMMRSVGKLALEMANRSGTNYGSSERPPCFTDVILRTRNDVLSTGQRSMCKGNP